MIRSLLVTSLVMHSHAKRDIADEFARWRLVLPLALHPDDTRPGCIIFPISAGPKRLIIAGTAGTGRFTLRVELARRAGLHLARPNPS